MQSISHLFHHTVMKGLVTLLLGMTLLLGAFTGKAQGQVNVDIYEVSIASNGTTVTYMPKQNHCPGDVVWYNIVTDHYDNFKTRVLVTNGEIVNYKPLVSPSQLISPTEVLLQPQSGVIAAEQAFVQIRWTTASGALGNLHAIAYYHFGQYTPIIETADGYYNQQLNTTTAPVIGQGTYTVCGTNTVAVGVYPQQGATSYTWYSQNYSVQVNGQGTYYGVTTTDRAVQLTLPAGAAPTTYQLYVQSNSACGSTPLTTFYVQVNCATTAPSNVSFVTSSSGTACAPRYDVRVSRVSSATSYTATLHGGAFEGYSLTINNPNQYAYYIDFPFNIAGPVVGISASVTATSPGGTSAPDYSPVQNLAGGAGCRTGISLTTTTADGQAIKGIYPNPATDKVIIAGIEQEAQVDFYDVRGARCKTVVLHESNTQTSVNLSDLPAGLYNIRISANGKVLQTSKLVVKH